MRKTTDMRRQRHEIRIHVFLVLVALLKSTPGVYVGVNVRSETLSSAGVSLFSCRRAAIDLKVGKVMSKELAGLANPCNWEETTSTSNPSVSK